MFAVPVGNHLRFVRFWHRVRPHSPTILPCVVTSHLCASNFTVCSNNGNILNIFTVAARRHASSPTFRERETRFLKLRFHFFGHTTVNTSLIHFSSAIWNTLGSNVRCRHSEDCCVVTSRQLLRVNCWRELSKQSVATKQHTGIPAVWIGFA